jgi:hypothetical protein
MKPVRIVKRRLPLVVVAGLSLSFAAGCQTYHYYDMDVSFGSTTQEEGSKVQFCQLVVTGADSHTASFPTDMGSGKSICPVTDFSSWPDIGTFEFASFADSGKITFTVNAYGNGTPLVSPGNLCSSGSATLTADSTITQMGTVTMGAFNDTNCPTSTTGGGATQ